MSRQNKYNSLIDRILIQKMSRQNFIREILIRNGDREVIKS